MCRSACVAILLIFVAGKSSGLEWIELTAGNALPSGTRQFPGSAAFVGRVRHYNSILPVQVWPNSTATIKVCGKIVVKYNFEILTSSTQCSWQPLIRDADLPDGLVRVGHRDATKSLFVGWRDNRYYPYSDEMYTFSLSEIPNVVNENVLALICPTKGHWVDVPAKKVPQNAVSAGKTTDGKDVFVARLQKECQIYPGEVVPDDGIATAWADGETIEARYCEVLTGDSDQYRWAMISDYDELPDNAVFGSTDPHNLYYIVKQLSNNATTYVTDLLTGIGEYEILVDNGKKSKPEYPQDPPEYNYDN